MDLKKKIEELTGQIETLEKQLDESKKAAPAAADLKKAKDELKAAQDTLAKAQEDLKKSQDEIEALKAKGKAREDMDEDEKEVYDEMEEDEKKKFVAMSKAKRKAYIEDIRKDDETVSIEGRTIRKSVVGEDTFLTLKSMHNRMEKNEKERLAAVEKAQNVELTKRATEELSHLPGEDAAKVKLLKSIAKLPDDEQATFAEMTKAGDGAMKAAFGKLGHGGGKEKQAGDFMKRVDEIVVSDRVTKTAAMRIARQRFPKEYEAFQDEGAQTGKAS